MAGATPNYAAYAWDSDASALPGWPLGLTQNVTGIAVGDVNDDGELEMVCTSTSLWNKRIWVISSSGQILHEWQPQVYFGEASENCPALADLDGDGDLEIIWGGYADFFVWHHDGTECWPGQILPGGGDVSPAAIGDLDGDGYLEVVACNSTVIYVWNSDGTFYEGDWPKRIPNTSLTWSGVEHSGPVIGDIDDDGEQEIVINGFHPTSGDGSSWPSIPTEVG